MNRHNVIRLYLGALCVFSFLGQPILSAGEGDGKAVFIAQEQSAEVASKLANEKCKETFAETPFSPNSYEAKRIDERWYWGKIEPPGIRGYSAEVEFNVDGSNPKVRVVFHTDALGLRIERFRQKEENQPD